MAMKKRTYVGELEWAIGQIRVAFQDRNPNRAAQINGLLDYAAKVSEARIDRKPLPPRPTPERMV
jgi:hypothetical protein